MSSSDGMRGAARRGRHGWCHYCGVSSRRLTWDHVVPRKLGGPDKRWNLVTACEPCNRDKGDADMRDHCSSCATAWERHEAASEEDA